MKKILALALAAVFCLGILASCSSASEDNTVIIYSCASQTRIGHMQETLSAKFPDYDIKVESLGTGKLTGKLQQEKENTEGDIVHDLVVQSMDMLEKDGLLADLSTLDFVDTSIYVDGAVTSNYFLPEMRCAGGVIINTKVLTERGLAEPTCYEDLLKPEYKGLVSMPNPNSSGTGFMFYKSLVNAWGEEKAVEYFGKLAENVLQFTSSGNGPVTAVSDEEAAIGLGMISDAAIQMTKGTALKILVFNEGAPYADYCQGIVKGKEEKKAVQEVFKYLIGEYNLISCEKWAPEKIFKDHDFTLENFPTDLTFSDMKNNTADEKARLLKLWPVVGE